MSEAPKKEGEELAAVMRAMDILEVLKGHSLDGMTLREISTVLKVTDSTVYRTLKAMEKREFVCQYENLCWALSVKVLGISRAHEFEISRRLTHTNQFDRRVTAEANS